VSNRERKSTDEEAAHYIGSRCEVAGIELKQISLIKSFKSFIFPVERAIFTFHHLDDFAL
jgi:hypothetical protein